MASIKEQFEVTGKMKTWSIGLISIGLLAFLIGLITKGFSSDEHEQTEQSTGHDGRCTVAVPEAPARSQDGDDDQLREGQEPGEGQAGLKG